MPEYMSGVCNIGKNEIRKRYSLAVSGFVIVALVSCAVLVYNLPRWALLLNFIPLIAGFEGFYQGYLRFCAGFAAAGLYDFTGSGGSRGKVADHESRMADLRKAVLIHMYSFVSMAIVTAILYLALK